MLTTLDYCVIRDTQTLRDALMSLEKSSAQVVLITDDCERVIGLMTDGDIRRALLCGVSIEQYVTPYIKRDFIRVSPQVSRVDVLEIMQARFISQVPVLDEQGRLCGLHRLQDIVRRQLRPNWAVVMAGGKGTRLAPLTHTIPKPMLRVAGRPILERILLQLVGSGISQIYLAINHLGHLVEEHFGTGQKFGCAIHYLREELPLGTGGALSLLPQRPVHPMLVMNGDLVTQADLGAMLDFHEAGRQVATVGVRRYLHNVPFGCFDIEDDRAVSIEEKPTLTKVVNAGMYVLSPALIDRVPRGKEFPLPSLLEEALRAHEIVRVYEVEEDWIDVGQRDQLRQARGEVD